MPAQSVAFDRAAEYYDETRGFPPGVEIPVAAMVARTGNLDHHSQVLEIGIGTGRIGLPLAAHVEVYCGIDLSLPMMHRLRAKQTTEPVMLAQADATRLPFPDDSFDAAVSVHVFHLIPNWTQALAEVGRILRPGGLLLNCWNNWIQNDPRVGMLWEAWDNAVPEERRPTVGAKSHEDPEFIQKQGWIEQGNTQSHDYTSYFSPAAHLDFLKQRVWSRHWTLSDEDHAIGMAAVKAVIAEQFDDVAQTIEQTAQFNAQPFLPPKTAPH